MITFWENTTSTSIGHLLLTPCLGGMDYPGVGPAHSLGTVMGNQDGYLFQSSERAIVPNESDSSIPGLIEKVERAYAAYSQKREAVKPWWQWYDKQSSKYQMMSYETAQAKAVAWAQGRSDEGPTR